MNITQQEIKLVHWLLNLCEADPILFAKVKKELGTDHRRVRIDTIRRALNAISTDAHLSNDSDKETLIDVTPATDPSVEEQVEGMYNKSLIRKVLADNFSPRNRDILIMRFELGDDGRKNLREIGKAFNLSPESIRRIELKAIKTLAQNPILRQLYDD